MLERLFALYRPWVAQAVIIVQPDAAQQIGAVVDKAGLPVSVRMQEKPSGMLDAVMLAGEDVQRSHAERVWITWCDQIAIHPRTVEGLAARSDQHATAGIVMPVVRRSNPYIHLDRDERGRIVRVLHRREGDQMPLVGESDAGLFSLSREAFLERLPEYAREVAVGHATGERNLLPFLPWLSARAEVVTFPATDEIEAVGVNTPEELADIEAYLARRDRRVLSIVIPAYNEERFIGTLLDRIKAVDLSTLGLDKQIIVVDDGSRDGTAEIVQAHSDVMLRRMARNGGKGRAVRAGIEAATGDYLVIQDADLEYDPNDYLPMLQALVEGKGDVIYGSRYLGGGRHPNQSWAAYIGGRSLSLIALMLTGRYMTDTVTALKLFLRTDVARLPLETSGFELDHEITSRLIARGKRIAEVPIKYFPRSREEGKKIGMRDWFIACRTFWRYRRG
jgi:dolichol-phosphate mannosyltransferase